MRAKRSRPLLATLGFMAWLLFLPAQHAAVAREGLSRSQGQPSWEGLRPSSDDAYARTTHVVRARVDARLDGARLELVKVTYTGDRFDGCFGAMRLGSVVRAGLDTDGDGHANEDGLRRLTGLVMMEEDRTLLFSFDGSLRVREGDLLELAYSDVVNPAAGSYRVEVVVNPEPSDAPQVSTLVVRTSGYAPSACTDGPAEDLAPSAVRATTTVEL